MFSTLTPDVASPVITVAFPLPPSVPAAPSAPSTLSSLVFSSITVSVEVSGSDVIFCSSTTDSAGAPESSAKIKPAGATLTIASIQIASATPPTDFLFSKE